MQIIDNGNILMVEYKDTNIPVIVQEAVRVKDLFRGDKIKIQFNYLIRQRVQPM